jgi:hypothetical protein
MSEYQEPQQGINLQLQGPTEEQRRLFAQQAHDTAEIDNDAEAERALENLLEAIHGAISEATRPTPERFDESYAWEVYDSVQSWASVINYVVATFYAPSSPFRRRRAGFSRRVVNQLRQYVGQFTSLMQQAINQLPAAKGWSVAVTFPWTGVQVGLDF